MSRRIISKKVREVAVKSYVKDGVSIADAAKNAGVGYESVRRWLNEAGISTSRKSRERVAISNKKSDYPRCNTAWTRGEDEVLRDAVLSGMTVKETADLLGRTKASIYCRKVSLINRGVIEDPMTRFTIPDGIKRNRKIKETEPVVEGIILDDTEIDVDFDNITIEKDVETVKDDAASDDVNTPIKMNVPELSDLAKIVKEYGVNVTVSVSTSGMEVKMTN